MKQLLHNHKMVILMAVFCNVLWGSAYPFVKIGYALFHITDSTATKILFAGIRFVLAGTMLLLFYTIKNKKVPSISRENYGNVCKIAIIQTTLEYIFFYIGLSNTAASNGSIVNSVSAFFGVLLSGLVYRYDSITFKKIVGCVIGFMGVIIVTLGEGRFHFAWNGEGFIMLAALTFSIGSMISKRASKLDEPFVITGYNLFSGGMILVILGLAMGGRITITSLSAVAVLAYLSLLSAAAFLIWTYLLEHHPAGELSFYNFVIPVSGTIFSAIFLGENILKWNYALSLVCIVVGILCVSGMKFKSKIDV